MITAEEFVERLCRLGVDRGPRGFPRRRRDRQILMKSIVMGMDSSRTYTEAEVNALLVAWNREIAPAIRTDPVSLRRLLVDHGLLERRPDGSAYRLGFPANPVVFDLDVDDVDVRAALTAFRADAQRRRLASASARASSCAG